jgi:hypothetical protein
LTFPYLSDVDPKTRLEFPIRDALFLNLVQNYFNTLEGIGLMELLRAKWFEDGSWLATLP